MTPRLRRELYLLARLRGMQFRQHYGLPRLYVSKLKKNYRARWPLVFSSDSGLPLPTKGQMDHIFCRDFVYVHEALHWILGTPPTLRGEIFAVAVQMERGIRSPADFYEHPDLLLALVFNVRGIFTEKELAGLSKPYRDALEQIIKIAASARADVERRGSDVDLALLKSL